MIGPKLDARSYTNLILVAIALLLAINLLAQPPQSKTLYTPEAQATQQVADAVRAVATSNQQIAQALNRVADSIIQAGDRIATAGKGHTGSTSSMMAPGSSSAPSRSATGSSSSAPAYQGSVELVPTQK